MEVDSDMPNYFDTSFSFDGGVHKRESYSFDFIPMDLWKDVLGFLTWNGIGNLDSAMCNFSHRHLLLYVFETYCFGSNIQPYQRLVDFGKAAMTSALILQPSTHSTCQYCSEFVAWLSIRNIKVAHFVARPKGDKVSNDYLRDQDLITLMTRPCYSPLLKGTDFIRWSKFPLFLLDLSDCNDISDSALQTISKACKSLLTLTLTHCRSLAPSSVATIVHEAKGLEHVDISDGVRFTDGLLSHMAHSCRNLRSVRMSTSPGIVSGQPLITSAAVIQIAQCCPALEILVVRGWREYLFDDAMVALGNYSKHIKELDIGGCIRVTDFGIGELAAGCRSLQILNVSGCIFLTDASLVALAATCPGLHSLRVFNCCRLSDVGICALANGCRKLFALNISRQFPQALAPGSGVVTITSLMTIVINCETLEDLNYSGCVFAYGNSRALREIRPKLRIVNEQYGY